MPDFSKMKLGKQPPKFRSTDLKLANYVGAVPSPPKAVDFTYGIKDWGELGNDVLGDCTIAAPLHGIQSWRMSLGQPLLNIPTQVAIDYYSKWCGYVPGDPSTDNGGIEADVLKNWRKSTITIDGVGHNQKAYASVNPQNLIHVIQTVWIFGGSYIGLRLPISAQNQDVWDVVQGPEGTPGSWGLHAAWLLGYDHNGVDIGTWGAIQRATWDFWLEYVDEAWAAMSDTDFTNPDSDFPYEAMLADVKAVTG